MSSEEQLRLHRCCFTGHRASKLSWGFDENDARCIALKERIYNTLCEFYSRGYRNYICGMANGCDMYFGEAVIRLIKLHDDVKLEAAIPCDTQANGWPPSLKKRYDDILSAAGTVTFVQHMYSRGCMMRRNKYMVDNSSALIACYDGCPGGTMNTLLIAQRAGLEIEIIDIDEL